MIDLTDARIPVLGRPPLVLDLTDQTLALGEPGLRVVDAATHRHVASILPDATGAFDHADLALAVLVKVFTYWRDQCAA